jgi:hypothetical protein
MQKRRIEYQSPVDALVVVAKRLSRYEEHYNMRSEDFFDKFSKGALEDSEDFIEWSNGYQHYLALKLDLEKQLRHAA